MLADEKVMPEKKPTLVLTDEKAMSDEKKRRRKTSQSRSPPPPSFLPGDPADGPESGIATAGEHVDKMSNKAEEEPYITSTKNPFALLGELKDAGEHVDKMSGCAWRRSVYTTIATCRAHPAARRHCERRALFGNHANAETAVSALGETCLIWQPCEC